MLEIKKEATITIDFEDFLEEVSKDSVSDMIQKISDNYENYEVDALILNKIVKIILDCAQSKDDLQFIDINPLQDLMEVLA